MRSHHDELSHDVPGHDGLAAALARAGISIDAAPAHGTLTGMLCASPQVTVGRWIAVLLEDCEAGRIGQEALASLAGHGEALRRALESQDLGFEPLLPGDEVPVSERSRAVAEWCSAFLYGLAVGGFSDPAVLQTEGREFLGDLSELTRVLGRSVEREDAESHLIEVVEYVRAGVLSVHAELAVAGRAGPGGPGPDPGDGPAGGEKD